MGWTHYQKLLALVMVVTGSFNTLSVKYADIQEVKDLNDVPRKFNHPFVQSGFMFFGEILCFLVFKIAFAYSSRRVDGSTENNSLTRGSQNFNPLVLLVPACCDAIATSIMYVGLNLTYASSFQMLRGAVIVFTGILSVGFLDRKLGTREWSGIALVIAGLALVGASDLMTKDPDSDVGMNSILTGDLLIICAQVISSIQMVVEEKFVAGQDIPPLQAIGWEGIFGFIGISIAIVPLNYIPGHPPFADNSRGTLESIPDAFAQIRNSGHLLMAIVGITLSIAFFNFAGLSITKETGATTRMILDSVRTIVIWAFSLAFGWQDFHYLQLIGFCILIIGMSSYNNVIVPQLLKKCQSRLGRHRAPQLADKVRVLNAATDDLEDNAQ